jgi:hypothetical protein
MFMCHLPYRYTEAIALFKSPQDAPWHASALEGMATVAVIDAWLSGHGLVRMIPKPVWVVHTDLADFRQAPSVMDKNHGPTSRINWLMRRRCITRRRPPRPMQNKISFTSLTCIAQLSSDKRRYSSRFGLPKDGVPSLLQPCYIQEPVPTSHPRFLTLNTIPWLTLND